MRTQAALGYDLLVGSGFSPEMLQVVRSHQEMLDGSGYPDGPRGLRSPDLVRLVRICDTYGALIERRPYRAPLLAGEAYGILCSMATTATVERGESWARPQTPWPEVQPEPSRVPKPTSSPASASTGKLASIRIHRPAAGEQREDRRPENEPVEEGEAGAPGLSRKTLAGRARLATRRPIAAIWPSKRRTRVAGRPIRNPPAKADAKVLIG